MDRAILLRSVRRMALLPAAGAIFSCSGCPGTAGTSPVDWKRGTREGTGQVRSVPLE